MSGTPAAFFDLDRTVMRGASTWHFGVAALKHGFYSPRALAHDGWELAKFVRRGSTDASADAIRAQILGAVRGHRRTDMYQLGPEVLGPILAAVRPEVHTRILEHESEGVRTYLCSAAPVEILEPLARTLQMSGGAIGTVAAVDAEGCYTGELVGPFCYGPGKRAAVVAEAARAGLDLERSHAYSDSASDLPLLEAVGHPVVVRPGAALAALAAERGWNELPVAPPPRRWPRRLAVLAGAASAGFVAGRALRVHSLAI